MIKELITDIAYDKINLAQALTRAKLIANKVNNSTFKEWLSKELLGYRFDDESMPEYRKIWSEIELVAEFPFGQKHAFPVVLEEKDEKKWGDFLNYHRVVEPIAIIEENIKAMNESKVFLRLPAGQTQLLGELYEGQIQAQGGVIRSGRKLVSRGQYQNIIELTKQKLIDTLQELENEFPEIDQHYIMNEDNKEKIQNIITTNIYGNNNPLNIAAGVNNSQNNTSLNDNQDKLREIGVTDDEIHDLEKIDIENPKGSSSRSKKMMGWLGSVSSSLVARGIYDKIPQLTEYISSLL